MNTLDVHDMLTTPLAMTAVGFVIVVLMALTMNAVVKRERAIMVRALRHDSAERLAYMARWRNRTSA